MNMQYFNQLLKNGGLTQLLSDLNWSDLESLIASQEESDYNVLSKNLLEDKISCFIFPLHHIPFERDEQVQLAAVSVRRDERFYLINQTEVKNMAFLDETHTIQYANPIIPSYVREINQKVKLEKVDEFDNPTLAITQGQLKNIDSNVLSPEEFTTHASSGIYCIVCKKSNKDLRKQVAKYHEIEIMELSNIERGIQQKFHKREDVKLLGVHVSKDSQAYFHGVIALLEKHQNSSDSIRYYFHSQSTTHLFMENILQLITK